MALCLQHRAIPPSLHFEVPNPAVPWDELPLIVQREYGVWPTAEVLPWPGVSSFGIPGTNVHVVLSDAPAARLPGLQPTADGVCLLPLSAHTPDGLAETVALFQDFLDSGTTTAPADSDICYTARRATKPPCPPVWPSLAALARRWRISLQPGVTVRVICRPVRFLATDGVDRSLSFLDKAPSSRRWDASLLTCLSCLPRNSCAVRN